MRYTPRQAAAGDPLYETLEGVARSLGMALVELTLSRHKGSVQVRGVVCRKAAVGVNDCSRVHHAMLPLLEQAFPGQDLYVELSSPGIDRVIKDGREFVHYLGRGVRCYRTDISDWTGGVLRSADENGIVLKGKDGSMTALTYECIAKAKLDDTIENMGEV
ncbi:ribosome maturation factor RimP [Spirochaetia bacterium]|nr:ribosome maturation factor RimP [Spirochaetia bacterium]